MRCIFILFDSLNRAALPAYGGKLLPNFARLAERGTVFDNHYVGSMPCMPARRDMMTGNLNFLHRGWGPLEPFDLSFPELLRESGIYSHLITDHYHYFEDGGFGYHGRYDSWDFIRGQEKDKWRSTIAPGLDDWQQRFDPTQRDHTTDPNGKAAYYASHRHLSETGGFPLTRCFDAAINFVGTHAETDNWLLQLECFDPHEPFFLGDEEPVAEDEAAVFDWPAYGRNTLEPDRLDQLRSRYGTLVERCDRELGRLLDELDERNLWDDTIVVLTTDHGLMLGEKEFLGKNRPPFYNEVAHIPLIVAAPGSMAPAAPRVSALTQTIDLMPTFLEVFGCPTQPEIAGRSLLPLLNGEAESIHDGILYGQFGAALNYTDGITTCFRYPLPDAGDLYQYTLMPTHMRSHFERLEFEGAETVTDMPYSRGFPVWRLPMKDDAKANMIGRYPLLEARDALFDLPSDPGQASPLKDTARSVACYSHMARLLKQHHAPAEIFERFGLDGFLDGSSAQPD